MMRGVLLIIGLWVAVMLTSCNKDPEPLSTVRFSVLGDSYSTYEGYVDPATNDVWLYWDSIGITSVEQLWWYQRKQTMGWELEKNNAFSGSLISNMDFGGYYGPHSFLRRMDDLGNPDVIFVFGGINDVWSEVPIGDFVYDNWTEEELCMFRPALACLFHRLQRQYPGVQLYYMADDDLDKEYMESAHIISSYYDVHCIDLHAIKKIWRHPNEEGMTSIANQVLAFLLGNQS